MLAEPKVIETDVLVIGSGGAGSRAAIEVARNGLAVLITTKGVLGKSGDTLSADMDINVPSRDAKEIFGLDGDIGDSPDSFAQDILQAGKYMNNEEVVLTLCTNVSHYVKELIDWGMDINGLSQGPGHRFPRGIVSTGRSMVSALKRGMRQYKIDLAEYTMVTHLLTRNGRVVGAVGINIRSGDLLVLKAKAVILATGGAMRLYPLVTAAEELTGDGMFLAYEAGAELVDMEFPMFLPACVYWPESMKGVIFPYVFSTVVGGWWLNRFGERFIEKWGPTRMERDTTRDIAAIAQSMEISRKRGGPHGGIFVSFKHIPDEIMEYSAKVCPWWPNFIYGQFNLLEFDMDPRKVAYEAGPAAHYWNGGVKVNRKSETSVPGLYAAGEVQGGTQGANRLAGNGVAECLVFGALAGSSAAAYVKDAPEPDIDGAQVNMYCEQICRPLSQKTGTDVLEFRKRIQDTAFDYIGPIRDEHGLVTCIGEIEKLNDEALHQTVKNKGKVFNREWVLALENEVMLRILEIVTRASLLRKESRGALYRIDYPDTDNKDWLKNIIITNKNNQVSLETKPIVTSRLQLPKPEKVPYLGSSKRKPS